MNRNHLRDLVTGLDVDCIVSQVGQQDKDFTSIAGIDYAAGRRDSSRCHRRPITHQQTQRSTRRRIASLNRDSGADFDRGTWQKYRSFESEYVVAEVFTSVCDYREAGTRFKPFYSQHEEDDSGLICASAIRVGF
jgi:hypothetical protein